MRNSIYFLFACLASTTITAQTPNDCGNYTTTGSVMNSNYPDPDPGCASNVPGVATGPAYWDGAGCSGQLVSSVVGAPVNCLTLAYSAVNTDDYATLAVDGGGIVTITAVNCGVSGSVIGPYNCGSGFYGTCGITICSTIPFTTVTLTNTGCSSGWVIDCATPIVCVDPVITPEPDLTFCSGTNVPANAFVSTPAGATFAWTNSNPSVGLAGSGTGGLPAFVATNGTTAPITATITVTPTSGACIGLDEVFTITINPIATASANIDQTICEGGTVTLAGTIGGGAATSTWSAPSGAFSDVTSLTSTYTPTITSGTVTLTLTTNDPAGPCLAVTDLMIVTVNPLATVNANVDQTACEGGTITLAGAIGGGAGTSTWSAPSGTFSNSSSLTSTYSPSISSGTVTLTLTTNDPAGPCLAVTDVMIVTVTPGANVSANIDQTVCAGSSITLAGTIGGLASSSTWSAPSGIFSNASSLTSTYTPSILSGTVTITITTDDPAGQCLAVTDQLILTVNPLPAIAVTGVDPTTCLGSDGFVTITGLASTTNYNVTYNDGSLVGPAPMTSNGAGDIIISGLIAGTYSGFAVELNGCVSTSPTVISLVDPLPPIVNAGVDQSICESTTATLTANNPDSAVITWNNSIFDGTPFSQAIGTVTYTVTANLASCISTDQVNVTVNPLPILSFLADSVIGCTPFSVNFTNLSTPIGNDCEWKFGDGSTAVGCGGASHNYSTAGIYSVSLTVTTMQGCTDSVTYNNYITVSPSVVASFNFSPETSDVDDPYVQFTNHSYHADTYIWTFGDNSPTSTEENPGHLFPEVPNTSYVVELYAENAGGCFDSTSLLINIADVIVFYVPNVFTPDGDEFNEIFQPVFYSGYNPYDFHLMIFNRWGEIVFESYNASVGWTGTYGNQGLVEDGVYIWQIEFAETMSDKRHTHRGHVTVLK